MIPRAHDPSRSHEFCAATLGHLHAAEKEPVDDKQTEKLGVADLPWIVDSRRQRGRFDDSDGAGLFELFIRQLSPEPGIGVQQSQVVGVGARDPGHHPKATRPLPAGDTLAGRAGTGARGRHRRTAGSHSPVASAHAPGGAVCSSWAMGPQGSFSSGRRSPLNPPAAVQEIASVVAFVASRRARCFRRSDHRRRRSAAPPSRHGAKVQRGLEDRSPATVRLETRCGRTPCRRSAWRAHRR